VCTKGGPCVLFIAFESPVDAVPSDDPSQKPSTAPQARR
jgi:hypothetical protein